METTECRSVTEQTLGYRNNDLYISAAGIPDFRSPETGLYSNLQKYNLPNPMAIFALDYFRVNTIMCIMYLNLKNVLEETPPQWNRQDLRIPVVTYSTIYEKGTSALCACQI